MLNHYPIPEFTTTPTLIVGKDPLARVQCFSCKALFLPYVDRGDGTPLRWDAQGAYVTGPDGVTTARVDYSLTMGPAVAAKDAFENCPECGAVWNNVMGQPGAEFVGIKGRLGTNACDSICAFAIGTTCKCSCAGLNHGSRS
jgi:hypothetical protein